MSTLFLYNFVKSNEELARKFSNKKIFIVNHTSFYGKLYDLFFSYCNEFYSINAEVSRGSRENGFDILNKKDVNFWSYRDADIIIYPGVDFSDYKDTDSQMITSINLVTGLSNLLEIKKQDCLFYYFNSNVTDLLYCSAIYAAIDLGRKFLRVNPNCFEPYHPIFKENSEYCLTEMIKDIVKKIK